VSPGVASGKRKQDRWASLSCFRHPVGTTGGSVRPQHEPIRYAAAVADLDLVGRPPSSRSSGPLRREKLLEALPGLDGLDDERRAGPGRDWPLPAHLRCQSIRSFSPVGWGGSGPVAATRRMMAAVVSTPASKAKATRRTRIAPAGRQLVDQPRQPGLARA